MPVTRDGLALLKRPALNGDGAALSTDPAVQRQLIREFAASRGWSNTAGSYFGFASACGYGLTGETAEMRRAYPEMAFREPSVKAPLLSRMYSVASQDAECKPPKGARESAQAVADGFLHALRHSEGGIPQIVWELGLPAAIDGTSLCEIVFNERVEESGPWVGKRMLKAIKNKSPNSYQLKFNDFGDLVAVKAASGGETFVGDALTRFVLYRPQRLYGEAISELRAAYGGFVRKDRLWKLREYYLDKFGGPFLKGKARDGERVRAMKAALAAARAEGYIVVLEGEEVETVDLAMGPEAAFKSAIDDCDRDMAIGVGGGHLPFREGQTPGVRGDSQQQTDMTSLWSWKLSFDVQHLLTTRVAPLWTSENYSGADSPEFLFGGVDRQEQAGAVEQVSKLIGAGYSLSKSQVADRTGWVAPKDDADRLAGAQPKPQSAGVGAAGGRGTPAGFAEGWELEAVAE